MKFQNPSFNFFFERTDEQTSKRTDKPKAICSPLFQSWGHKKALISCAATANLICTFIFAYANSRLLSTSCRKLYCFVVYLYVNGSGSITLVGEERANLSAVVYL